MHTYKRLNFTNNVQNSGCVSHKKQKWIDSSRLAITILAEMFLGITYAICCRMLKWAVSAYLDFEQILISPFNFLQVFIVLKETLRQKVRRVKQYIYRIISLWAVIASPWFCSIFNLDSLRHNNNFFLMNKKIRDNLTVVCKCFSECF